MAVPVERASVVLVTDTSGSMIAHLDVEPSRSDVAKARRATGSSTTCPTSSGSDSWPYADAPGTVVRPTEDRDEVPCCARPPDRPTGGTATGDALDSALAAPPGTRGEDAPPAAIVLLSDGATQSGRDPAEVARAAARAGVPISTVALGSPDGHRSRRAAASSAVPLAACRRCARSQQLSGGTASAVEDADALNAVYERLGSQIGTRKEQREISAGLRGRRSCCCSPLLAAVAALARAPACSGAGRRLT